MWIKSNDRLNFKWFVFTVKLPVFFMQPYLAIIKSVAIYFKFNHSIMKVEALSKSNSIPEIELLYTPPVDILTSPRILDSESAYWQFIDTWNKAKLEFIEQFKVLVLNRAHRVLGICTLSTGGLSSTIIDIRLLFAVALKSNASAIIVAHNHPSGELTPSKNDIIITKRIYDAGKILDIEVLDHLIINKQSFYSFKNEGAI
jgi:DNA repair protein RadC